MFRKATQYLSGSVAKGLSGLPDDDLVCCGDRVAVLASVYEDGAGVTLLRYFQNTQHSLSFSGTHLSQQQPPRTPSQSSSAQGIPTQWTGQSTLTFVGCDVERMSHSKTSPSVNICLSNNRRKINERIQHEEKFFRVFKLTLSLLLTSHKNKNVIKSFLFERIIPQRMLFVLFWFVFISIECQFCLVAN